MTRIAEYGIVECCGDDKFGRKTIVCSACRLPNEEAIKNSDFKTVDKFYDCLLKWAIFWSSIWILFIDHSPPFDQIRAENLRSIRRHGLRNHLLPPRATLLQSTIVRLVDEILRENRSKVNRWTSKHRMNERETLLSRSDTRKTWKRVTLFIRRSGSNFSGHFFVLSSGSECYLIAICITDRDGCVLVQSSLVK